VFVFAQESLGGNVDYARAEMFRINDRGKIAEHWASHVLDEKNRKNANGTFDGMSVDRTVDYAARNVASFESLDDTAFNKHDLGAFRISRIPEYKQHSPKGGDGLEGLHAVLSNAMEKQLNFGFRLHHDLCDGDLLVSHRLYFGDNHPLLNHHTFDVFRFNKEGKAVEHWDVMDINLPPPDRIEGLF
jgi:predicted SnoaL-like aldol condensation-catalyzing enzyme